MVPNYQRCEKMVNNRQRCQWQNCKELESNAKCSNFWGYFINVRNTHVCYMKFEFVRIFHKMWDIVTKYVTYWYQIFTCCEELIPILQSVKFTKCEICGLTRRSLLNWECSNSFRQPVHYCSVCHLYLVANVLISPKVSTLLFTGGN